jgi:signal transduction histidine kinase
MRDVRSRSAGTPAAVAETRGALEARVRTLEGRNRDLLEVISVAGHDLKEPLRNLRASAESLVHACGGSLGDEARDLLGIVLSQAQRTEHLVDDLLTYARMTGGPLRREPCPLEHPLQWALANLQGRIEEEDANVTHDPLPSVDADLGRMIQLFQNLIANALLYSGPSPARVHVGAREREGEWLLTVRDSGIGVPPDDRERIFEPFARLHPESRYPGTGLGLAICRGIVDAHGGKLWVESSPEGGATFAFTLRASAGPSPRRRRLRRDS